MDNDPLSFNNIEFELNGPDIGVAHFFDDQASCQGAVFPNHFQNDRTGDEIFLDAVESALTGSGNGVGSEKIGGPSRRAQELNEQARLVLNANAAVTQQYERPSWIQRQSACAVRLSVNRLCNGERLCLL